jgi:hypothetical protein
MSFTVHTSDLGFRSERPGPQPLGDRPYYAFLGASDVFGNGLDYNETFVGIFADEMKRHGTDVLNMAVAGHHLLEQEALFKQFIESVGHRPQAVIIVFNPLFIGGYDDIHKDTVVRRGEVYDKNHWKVALTKMILANTSAVYCFFRDGIRKIQIRYLNREDFSLSFFIQRFSSRHPIRNPEKTEDFLTKLRDLENYIRGLGSRPICVYCPPAGEFQMNELVEKGKLERGLIDTKFFEDLIEKHCATEGIEFLTLVPPVTERFKKGEKLNFDSDGHYNAATSRLVGDYLYNKLRPDRNVGNN